MNRKYDKAYKVETETVTQAGAVEAHCNTITFVNKSAIGVTVNVDGYELAVGEALTDTGQKGEWNNSRYEVTGSTPTFRLIVRRKIYQ